MEAGLHGWTGAGAAAEEHPGAQPGWIAARDRASQGTVWLAGRGGGGELL